MTEKYKHIATILPPDPLDERDGFRISQKDIDTLSDLPGNTKLYIIADEEKEGEIVLRFPRTRAGIQQVTRELLRERNQCEESIRLIDEKLKAAQSFCVHDWSEASICPHCGKWE